MTYEKMPVICRLRQGMGTQEITTANTLRHAPSTPRRKARPQPTRDPFWRHRKSFALVLVVLAAIGVIAGNAALAANETFVVNSLDDRGDAVEGDSACDTGVDLAGGVAECTLRAAIEEANSSNDNNAIHFDFALADQGLIHAGVWTIAVDAELPRITEVLTIEGDTQPGFVDTPVVVLSGANTTTGHGLDLTSVLDVSVEDLAIVDFTNSGLNIDTAIRIRIANNFIGVLPDGTIAPNGGRGIRAFQGSNDLTIENNVIGANGTGGTQINGSQGAMINGNFIGVTAAGDAIGNTGPGIEVIGITTNTNIGSSSPNVISNNTGAGVAVIGSGKAHIVGNSIYANGGLGIDLENDGVTPNDVGADDADNGASGLLNHPVPVSHNFTGGTGTIDFELDTAPGTYLVHWYENPSGADPSGFGEGEVFIGSEQVIHAGGAVTHTSAPLTFASDSIVTATLTDEFGDGTSEFGPTIIIDPNLPNERPEFLTVDGQTASTGTLFLSFDAESLIVVDVTATDPDVGDTLTYSSSTLPNGLFINPTTGQIAGAIVLPAGAGQTFFTSAIEVTDDDPLNPLSDTQNITWVISPNEPPEFQTVGGQDVTVGTPDFSFPEGTDVTIDIVATDPNAGDTLTYGTAPAGLPDGLSIEPTTGQITGIISLAPGAGFIATYAITVTDEHGLMDTQNIRFVITPPNQAPAITAVLNQTNQAGVPITPLQIVASDADAGDTLTYAATGLPNGLTIDANGEITGTPTFTTGLPQTVVITVTDDGNPALDATVAFDWTISEANQAPTINPVLNQTNQACLLYTSPSPRD